MDFHNYSSTGDVPADSEEVCRACLNKKKDMKSIFGSCLDSMFKTVTNLKLEKDDGFPQNMCMQCVLQTSRSFSFRLMCEKSDTSFRTAVKNITSKKMFDTKTADLDTKITDTDAKLAEDEDKKKPRKIDDTADIAYSIIEDSIDGDFLVAVYETAIDDCNDSDDHGPVTPPSLASVVATCQQCGDCFPSQEDLNVHISLHSFTECKACGKLLPQRAITRHMKTHLEVKPHACDKCDKTFADKSNLTKHYKKHTGELRNVVGKHHLCMFCGRQFKWRTSVLKHQKYHTGNNLLKCQRCPKQYVEARSLEAHIRTHTGERPFECAQCGKCFNQRISLEVHLRTHDDARPYSCDVCGRAFKQRGYVKLHMRYHTGVKPYACKECKKSFVSSSLLKSHMAQHKSKSCRICKKRFVRPESLALHERAHVKTKPFHCTICGKAFMRVSSLVQHVDVHGILQEKWRVILPFKCGMCDRKYEKSEQLSTHMNTHKSEEFQGLSVFHDYHSMAQQEEDSDERPEVIIVSRMLNEDDQSGEECHEPN